MPESRSADGDHGIDSIVLALREGRLSQHHCAAHREAHGHNMPVAQLARPRDGGRHVLDFLVPDGGDSSGLPVTAQVHDDDPCRAGEHSDDFLDAFRAPLPREPVGDHQA